MNTTTNTTITNKQIQETLININLLLGNISVSGNDVFTLADCRNAIKQLAVMIPTEDENTEAPKA